MHNVVISTATATPAAPSALVDRKALVAAMTFLAGPSAIVEARNTIPIVSNVLVEAVEGGARFTGTDLDVFASTTLEAAWDVPGAFTVDARGLLAAAKGCGDDTVSLTLTPAGLRVAGGGMAANVATLPVTDFPRALYDATADASGPSRFTLDAATLSADLERVRTAISTEETRYYLNGAYFHVARDGGEDAPARLRIAATDGHRLVRIDREAPAIDGAEFTGRIVPRKVVAAMLKALGKKPAGSVTMTFATIGNASHSATIAVGDWILRAKMIDGTFPDYSRVIPSSNPHRATLEAAALRDTVKRVTKPATDKGPVVKLTLSDAGGALEHRSAEGAHAAASVAAAWHDGGADKLESFVIGFRGSYLADMAACVATGDIVMHLADGSAPTRFETPDAPEFLGVLMPHHVDGATGMLANGKRKAFEPVASPYDVFAAAYRVAFVARDDAAMRSAIVTYRGSLTCDAGRLHNQLAMSCASIRATVARDSGDGRDAQRHAVRETGRMRRAAKRDSSFLRAGRSSFVQTFGRLARIEEREAASRAALAGLDGYSADDTRDVLPCVLSDGTRVFVLAFQLRDLNADRIDLVKSTGAYPRRRIRSVFRGAVARVIQPRGAKVKPAPVEPAAAPQDVTTPVEAVPAPDASVDALAARVAALEAIIAGMTPAVPVESVVAVPADTASDGRDAYIATLIAERDAARDDAAGATARAADFERIAMAERERGDAAQAAADKADAMREIATRCFGSVHAARTRTASRLIAARAAARTARRERIGVETGLAIASQELERLRPVAAAIAAMTGAAVTPVGAPTLRAVA